LASRNKTAADEDDVAPGNPATEDRHERIGQVRHPVEGEQEQNARPHGAKQPEPARASAGPLGSFAERIAMKMMLSTRGRSRGP
jgi:hypothetical protein